MANEQSRAALKKAQWTRQRRAEIKRLMRSGDLDPFELIAGNDERWEPVVRAWRVDRFLEFVPNIGPASAWHALQSLRIPAGMEFVGLTYERRRELADLVKAAAGFDVAPPTPQPIPPREGLAP